jgi:hypothetical protein
MPSLCCEPGLHGLIQHSFALQIDKGRRPFHGHANHELVAECFELPSSGGARFRVKAVSEPARGAHLGRLASHSPLVQHGLADVRPLQMKFLEPTPDGSEYGTPLPEAFKWAATKREYSKPNVEEARFIFADAGEEAEARPSNDFLVNGVGCEGEELAISQLLLEVIAQRRSRLFGLALAHRIVNVMLPHAILRPAGARRGGVSTGAELGAWYLQPLVSFIRDDRDHRGFRSMYSLTLFMVPVDEPRCGDRQMSKYEIEWAINAGWSLATTPPPVEIPTFEVRGPLPGYISRLAQLDLASLLHSPSRAKGAAGAAARGNCGPLTLRQATELLAFGVALRVARGGSARGVDERVKRRVGDDVVTSLGSARVSSLVFVDDKLTQARVREPLKQGPPPGRLGALMDALAPESRAPEPWSASLHREYRLDRAFVDEDTYAVGVLPKNRCLVIASAADAQHGRRGSGLMHAGSVAYMTIGAATAIGMMRAIDHDLEEMVGEDPARIADIDGEIAADLNEIYDLDITREAYRHLYRLLRDRLGIARDYETLQDKMSALYRATSTKHEIKSQRLLALLTAAIVALSVLILIFTVAKPG